MRVLIPVSVGLVACAPPSYAQTTYGTLNGSSIPAFVLDCLNISNIAVPYSAANCANPFPIGATSGSFVDGWSVTEGTKADSAYTGSGSASIVAALKGIYAALVAPLPAGTNALGSVTVGGTLPAFASTPTVNAVQSGTWNIGSISTLPALAAGSNVIGGVTQSGSWSVTVTGTPGVNTSVTNAGATNPTSTLTRPANTTAYASGQLIGSSTTAGSVTVPSFAIANSAGSAIIPLVRLATNATTGWGVTLTMTLWTGAPTYTNGDGGTYAVATSNGGKYLLGQYSCTLTQYGDGAAGVCTPNQGNFAQVTLASGTAIYWDLQSTSAITPISGQTFTVAAEVIN